MNKCYSVRRNKNAGGKIGLAEPNVTTRSGENIKTNAPPIYDSGRLRWAIVEEAKELYRYRDLLWSLVHRDLTIRYKRSTLGFLWTMLHPLLTMIVISMVFSHLFRYRVERFPVYLLSAILLYGFFQWATNQSISSLVWGGKLMNKIYLPKTIFVATACLVSLVNLLLALVPLAIIMIVNKSAFSAALLFLPISIGLTFIFALGVGLFVSTLAVFFTDISDIYSIALQTFYYLTPIFYPISIVPDKYVPIIHMNPMFYFVEIFRTPIYQGILPEADIVFRACLIAVGAFVAGWWLFTRKCDEFAYRV